MAEPSKPPGTPLRPPVINIRKKGRTQVGMGVLETSIRREGPRSIAPPKPMRLPSAQRRKPSTGLASANTSRLKKPATPTHLIKDTSAVTAHVAEPQFTTSQVVAQNETLLGLSKPTQESIPEQHRTPATQRALPDNTTADQPLRTVADKYQSSVSSPPLSGEDAAPYMLAQAPPPLPATARRAQVSTTGHEVHGYSSPQQTPSVHAPTPLGGLSAARPQRSRNTTPWVRVAIASGAMLLLGTAAGLLRDSSVKDDVTSLEQPSAIDTTQVKPVAATVGAGDKSSITGAVHTAPAIQAQAKLAATKLGYDGVPSNTVPKKDIDPNADAFVLHDDALTSADAVTSKDTDVSSDGSPENQLIANAQSATPRAEAKTALPSYPPETTPGEPRHKPSNIQSPTGKKSQLADSPPESPRITDAPAKRLVDNSLHKAPTCKQVLGSASFKPTKDTDRIRATVKRAERALRNGNTKGAHAVFCTAVSLGPNNYRAAMGLATLLLIRRDAEASAKWARRALELSLDRPRRAKNALADALVRVGREREARTLWLEAAPEPNPNTQQLNAYIVRLRDLAHAASKHYDQHSMERFYRRIISLQPENKWAVGQLAATLRRMKQPEAAEFWEAQASLMPPN